MAADPPAKQRGRRAWKILAPARLARAAAAALTLGAILLFLTDLPLLEHLELRTYDLRLRTLPAERPRHVTIAAIDEASLAALGRWPWSRSVHARLAERLDQLGARVIAYDLFYPERESAGADAEFARALADQFFHRWAACARWNWCTTCRATSRTERISVFISTSACR